MNHDTRTAPMGLRMTGLRAFPAEGARVGIVSCLECGAALFIDPDDTTGDDHAVNVVEIHREWHAVWGES